MTDMPCRFPATLTDCLADFLTLLKELPSRLGSDNQGGRGMDFRFRRNDTTGAAGRCRGLGCPQVSLIFPPRVGIQGAERTMAKCDTVATEDGVK